MVSLVVLAIVIDHVVSLDPSHASILLPCEPTRPERRGGHRVAPGRWIGWAAACFEIGVTSNKWLISVISFVFSVFSSPRWGIPDGTVNPHRPQWKGCRAFPRVPPNGHIIHEESETFIHYKFNIYECDVTWSLSTSLIGVACFLLMLQCTFGFEASWENEFMIDVVEDTTYNNSMFDIFFNNVVFKNIFYLKIYYNNIFIFLKSLYSNNIKTNVLVI